MEARSMCDSVRTMLAHVGYVEHFWSGVVSLKALANGPPNSQQALGLQAARHWWPLFINDEFTSCLCPKPTAFIHHQINS